MTERDLSKLPRYKREKLQDRQVKKVLKVMTGKRPRYKRMGECVRCGKCCETEDCKHFRPATADSPSSCAIHNDPNRPMKCKIYPANPPLNYDTCGYYFWDVLDKKKVRFGRDL